MFSKDNVKAGDVLFFTPEKLTILVVMTGDDGIRYIEPMDLWFDSNGGIITKYVTYATINEWTVSFGSIENFTYQK